MRPGFSAEHPHRGQSVFTTGARLEEARAAMVMLHGRGASAQDILSLANELEQPGYAFLAPQAAGNTWYPNRFTVPTDQNEPWLSSALDVIGELMSFVAISGTPPERTMLLGFSQGACLALEFAARNARRYGGVIGLSGALIGPHDAPRNYTGSLDGTPVFLGCSDTDFHIPRERVDQAAETLRALGGEVTERIYPNMDHTVNRDEIDFVANMMKTLLK
jgi:phospholipase/carboxylesterase